jgi:hypothetical protein
MRSHCTRSVKGHRKLVIKKEPMVFTILETNFTITVRDRGRFLSVHERSDNSHGTVVVRHYQYAINCIEFSLKKLKL